MFRQLLSGSMVSAAVIAAAPALAADVPSAPPPVAPAPAAPVQPTAYDWTGLYIGAHAGYFTGEADGTFLPLGPGYSIDTDGFAGGGQVGANWQIDQLVLGAEGDVSWANLEGSQTIPGGTASTEADWLSTVRARAGWAFDRFLVYGTGGIAFTEVDSTVNVPPVVATASSNHTGWTAGAGLEAAITDNLSVKGEYLFVDFGDERYNFAGAPADSDLSGSYLRAGLNYKFNLFQ